MKMDHHCPWINICCGHMNHANFTYFLFFAPIGCMHAFYILAMSLYYGLNYVSIDMYYGLLVESRNYSSYRDSATFFSYACNAKNIKELFYLTQNEKTASVSFVSLTVVVLNVG